MASLCGRIVLAAAKRNVTYTPVRFCKMMNDPIEHATGIEKRELLAKQAGNPDPFDMRVFKRGPGTKDSPNLIPSAFDARLVGCVCEEDQTYVQWMWLHQGQPKRCECGHWLWQHSNTMDSTLDRAAVSNYFANLNEISKKIALDIDEIRGAYEHIWDDLSREEQMEIVNETIIKPELALKYFDNFSTSTDSLQRILGTDEDETNGTGEEDRNANLYDGRRLQTFQYVRTGRKVVQDDSVGLYRDEHSAPFSHKTKSQINLTIFPPDRKDGAGEGGKPELSVKAAAGLLAKKLLLKSPKADDESYAKANGTAAQLAVKKDPAAKGLPAYDSEQNIILTEEAYGTKATGAGFLSKFNNLIFNQSAMEMTTAASAASITGSDEIDGGVLEQDEFDTDNDKVNLFTKSSNKSECLHRAQSSSVEEDDKNYDELNSLLGNSKGFDFLNNW
uniref:DUF4706 domain-containing protein n=1 Tax=Anopheles epiroticus TaxID=199890 RepID=A0A182P6F8_9DIPT